MSGVSSATCFVTNAADTTLSTTMAIASPHVAFSRKSVVLRTPMIWLDEEKPDARPPPLLSWMSTIPHISIAARITSTMINVYIVLIFLLLFMSLVVLTACAACYVRLRHALRAKYLQLACKVIVFFLITQRFNSFFYVKAWNYSVFRAFLYVRACICLCPTAYHVATVALNI